MKEYNEALYKIDISGNELNESELIIMKENNEIFEYLEELSITVKAKKSMKEVYGESLTSLGRKEGFEKLYNKFEERSKES